MKNGKKEFLMKLLIVSSIIGGFSFIILLPCCELIFPNDELEVAAEKAMFIWCASFFIPGGLFVFLLPILGLKQKQDKPEKLILDINNFEQMKLYLTAKLLDNQYEILEQGIINENEEYIFFIKDTGINIECFLLTNTMFYCDEKSQIVTNKANEIYAERFKNVFSRRAFSGYTLVCVDRVDNEFYKYLATFNESVPRERFYYSGYTFGGKILYLPIYKDSFASGELKKMRLFLKNLFSDRVLLPDGSMIDTKNQ